MKRHGGRTRDRGTSAVTVAPPKAGSGGRHRALELQAEIGNRSIARLFGDGNLQAPVALANRASMGNRAVQRFLPPPSGAVAAARRIPGGAAMATATVTSAGVNVRGGPSASAAKVGELLQGARVEVVGRSGPWLRVRFGGDGGWISSRFVKVEAAPSTSGQQGGSAPSFFGAFGDAAAVLAEELRSWWGAATGERAAGAAGDALTSNPQLAELLSKPTLSAGEIDKARALIVAEQNENRRGDLYEALQSKTPYLSQRDNQAMTASGAKVESATGNMCNLTSLAMSLSYLGVANPRPEMQFEDALEKIRQEKGFGARTTADGWGKLANELGVSYDFIGIGVTEGKQWWVTNVLPALREGKAVMLSISGHICRLQAVTDEGLVADDPYGASKLLAGGEHKWTFKKKNAFGKSGQLAGNDVLWPWADVAKHTMKWVAAFKK